MIQTYYSINRERLLSRQRSYDAAHKEEKRARRRPCSESDRLRDREYYAANRERIIARHVAYLRAHPEVNATHVAAWRARHAGAEGKHTVAEWRSLVERHGGRCAYCGESRPLTRDHVIPLSRGGTNDIGNIVPACKPCNSKKGVQIISAAWRIA